MTQPFAFLRPTDVGQVYYTNRAGRKPANSREKVRTDTDMSKKDYEAAARLIQAEACGALYRAALIEIFSRFFTNDNARFDAACFARACVPGANVHALVRA